MVPGFLRIQLCIVWLLGQVPHQVTERGVDGGKGSRVSHNLTCRGRGKAASGMPQHDLHISGKAGAELNEQTVCKGCTAIGMPLSCARGVQELKTSFLLLPRSSQIETL